MRRTRRAHTLLEIITAIVLVGIIMSITTVSYSSTRNQMRDNGNLLALVAADVEARRVAADNGMNFPANLVSVWRLPTGYTSVGATVASTGPKELSVRVNGNILMMAMLSRNGRVCTVVYDDIGVDLVNPVVKKPVYARDRNVDSAANCNANNAGPKGLLGVGDGTPEKPKVANFD